MRSPNTVPQHNARVFSDGKKWQVLLKPYETPNAYRSLAEIILVLSVYAALWFIASMLLTRFGWWASLPVSLVMSIMHVRIFSMFHDCTHCALFKSPVANEYAGHFIGIFHAHPIMSGKPLICAIMLLSGNMTDAAKAIFGYSQSTNIKMPH